MIKLIIFDLSEVCFNSEETIYLKEFSQRHKLNHKEFVNFYDQLLIQAEIGTISGKEIWDKIFTTFEIKNETFEKVLKEMMALRKPNDDTLRFGGKENYLNFLLKDLMLLKFQIHLKKMN
jgi:hypothetical protein